jgi:hypothetical protein
VTSEKFLPSSRGVALKKRSLFWLYRRFFEHYPERVSDERSGSPSVGNLEKRKNLGRDLDQQPGEHRIGQVLA